MIYAYDPIYGVPAGAIDGLFRSAYSGLAGTDFKRIDGSFHFVMLDQPEPFAAAVEAFLKK